MTLVDSHAAFAEAVGQTLDRRGYRSHVVTLAGAPSPRALMRTIMESRPQLVVAGIDLWSHREDQAEVYRSLSRHRLRVVSIIARADPYLVGEALCRAQSVATKDAPLNDFLATVRKTMNGQPTIGRGERDRLVAAYRREDGDRTMARARLASLTREERAILHHLMSGRVVADIAVLRLVSEQTVRSQVKAVLSKMQVSSQIAAVALAWDHHEDA